MICPRCHTMIEENSKFCPGCGLSISSNNKTKDKKNIIVIGTIISVLVIFFLAFLGSSSTSKSPLKDTEYINNSKEYSLSGYRIFIPNKYTVKENDNLFAVTDYQNSFTLEISDTISFKKLYSNLNILNENATSGGYTIISTTREKMNGKEYILLKTKRNNNNIVVVYTSVGNDSSGNATILVGNENYDETVSDVINIFSHAVK